MHCRELLILTFPAWPCPGAGWSDTEGVQTRLSAGHIHGCQLLSSENNESNETGKSWQCTRVWKVRADLACFISLIHCFIGLFHLIHSLFQSLHVSLHKTFHYVQCISLPEKTLSILIHCCFLNIPKGQSFKATGLHHSQFISLTTGVVKGNFLHWLTQEHCLCISVDK